MAAVNSEKGPLLLLWSSQAVCDGWLISQPSGSVDGKSVGHVHLPQSYMEALGESRVTDVGHQCLNPSTLLKVAILERSFPNSRDTAKDIAGGGVVSRDRARSPPDPPCVAADPVYGRSVPRSNPIPWHFVDVQNLPSIGGSPKALSNPGG